MTVLLFSHLVKLINTNNPTISKHHGTTLHHKVSGGSISYNTCCQTSCTATLSTGVDRHRGHTLHELQQLGFGSSWVSKEQHVDISSTGQTIGKSLPTSSKQKTSNGLCDSVVNSWLTCKSPE